MAQPRGIGLAQVPSSPTPQNSPLTRLGGALTGVPSGGAPQFADNPLGAIGLVLSNFAAGVKGQELPTTKIQRNQLQQQQLNLQQLRVTLDAVRQGVEMFSGLDPNAPDTQEQIDRFTAQFTPILGEGFGESLKAGLELDRTQGRQAIEGLVEHQERIQGICGFDRDCIQNIAANATLMAQFNESADQQRIPGIMQKFQAINQAIGDNELLGQLAEQGYTLAELQQLPEGFKFTPEEIRTISRNEQIQNLLISSGFEPPNLTAEVAKATRLAEVQINTALSLRQPPNLSFHTIEEDGIEFLVGLDPRTGDEVSRRQSGLTDDDIDNLSFQRIRENGQEFIVGLDPKTGQVVSRVAAGQADAPNLSFQTIEEGDEKFLVGLDPETGDEVSRIRQGALVPSDPPNLTFKEITEGSSRFIVGLNPQTGQEVNRIPAGKTDEPFDSTRLRAGLSLAINGQDVEGRGLGGVVESIVKDMDPSMAATMLGQLASGGFEITTTSPDGDTTTIRVGGAAALTPGERVTDKRLAEEQAPIPTGVANLVGLDPSLTLAEAREQGISIPRTQVLEKIQLQRTDVQSLIRESRELIEEITGRPEILSVAGGIASAINSLRSTATGLVRSAGIDIRVNGENATVDELLREENYADALQELGVKTGQASSRLIGLAFAAAAAAGQTGRGVSDRDIELFIRRIGNSADPAVTINVLKDLIGEADTRFSDTVDNAIGRRPASLREEARAAAGQELEALMRKPLVDLTQEEMRRLARTPEGNARLRELLQGSN